MQKVPRMRRTAPWPLGRDYDPEVTALTPAEPGRYLKE